MPLHCHIVRPPRLAPSDREAMLALQTRYYDRVRREVFLADLSAKDWAIVLRDDAGRIGGFSTVQCFGFPAPDGAPVRILFSGDTVVGLEHRHSSALAGGFGHVMLRAIDTHAPARVYWLLITKGHRTYRFLPVFFHRFYPACDRCPPPAYPALLEAAARQKFGAAYDARAGIVRHAGRGDCLRPPYDAVPPGRECDPHVAFFLRRNPAYRDGDELACLAEVSRDNFNRRVWRVIRETKAQWHE